MGSKRLNVIEINGRRYDAATGKPVPAIAKQSVKHIEGIAKAPTRADARAASHARRKAARDLHLATKKSTTLNRAGTQKPIVKAKVNPQSSIPVASSAQMSGKSALHSKVSPEREQRAKQHLKSPVVSKFAEAAIVTQAVTEPAAQVEEAVEPVEPSITQPTPEPSPKEQLIADQLAGVEDHTADTRKRSIRSFFKRRPKLITILATGASTLLVVGYVTYLNIPNMALRVAASRAGFEANMPGYRPDGFRFAGPIAYSTGQITIQFSSNTDERNYAITERETNWDSQSLLENYVKPETDLYSTFQERGLTVYIYDGSNAVWVNGGIWYTIEGNSLLNSEQLLKIASSL